MEDREAFQAKVFMLSNINLTRGYYSKMFLQMALKFAICQLCYWELQVKPNHY